jgi:hypothetical protein
MDVHPAKYSKIGFDTSPSVEDVFVLIQSWKSLGFFSCTIGAQHPYLFGK